MQAALAPFVDMPPVAGYRNEMDEDPIIHAMVMLSVAEEAIAKATGDSPGQIKPRQCWGCFGLSHYESMPPHLFSGCPHKDDPEVQTRVRQKIEEFSCSRRNSQPGLGYYDSQLSRKNETQVMSMLQARKMRVQHSWKEEGFLSSEVATLICQAADPTTPPVVRACCLQLLQSCFEKKGEVIPRGP